ncbi:hypothetical protein [Saccharothrix variisporea]|uniref:Uncharacterized protein n=1 Tax=Saccharothrix variisporea TaxID=543527 RepID=A0A495X7S5_9PSEU|nr:hypothetical protein [Saccharothrix variisporea]RKT67578.1 hypothetical protein DFJ66_0754 [Saccharothrix variisporea]
MSQSGVEVVAPAVSEVERIAADTDPVVRNLRITHCYHLLSKALAARTGGSANWCTFAVWASKQVGQTIRQEDLVRTLERLSDPASVELLVSALRRVAPLPFDTASSLVRQAVVAVANLDGVSAAAARGNLKVFEEIAHEFARFLAHTGPIEEFTAALRPGEPPEGQHYLRQAFTRYHRAMATTDPKQRAESLLLANIEVGLHEQTRLQPEITAALEGPVVDPAALERRLLDLLLPGNRLVKCLRRVALTVMGRRGPIRTATERLSHHARALARQAVTRHLMTLALPDELLDLSEDLPASFPPLLTELSDPELLALLARVDPTPDSLTDTAAGDWSDLSDRMHYIADMFRCHAQRTALLDPPFTPEQVAAMAEGRRPSGRL